MFCFSVQCMLKNGFASFGKVKAGKAFYKVQTVGLTTEINIISLIENFKSKKDANNELYYVGQPISYDRTNNVIESVDFTAQDLKIDGIVGYSMIRQADKADKSNDAIGYITYEAGERIPTWVPKGQIVFYPANEIIKPKDKLKFVLDSNGVVKVAIASGENDLIIGRPFGDNSYEAGQMVPVVVSLG